MFELPLKMATLCRCFVKSPHRYKRLYITSGRTHGDKPILTLFTKKNTPCSLCDQAKEVLKRFSTQFHYEEKYIDEPSNEEWAEKYKWEIPVIHLNDIYLMKNKVDEKLLKKALEESRMSGIKLEP